MTEFALAPKLIKFKNDGKMILDAWQKLGGSVYSDQNILKTALYKEDLKLTGQV